MKGIAKIFVSTIFPLAVIPSCEKGKDNIENHSEIRIGKVTDIFPETKSYVLSDTETFKFISEGAEIDISLTEEKVCTAVETKASTGSTDYLKENGFRIDGIFKSGSSEKENHFMAAADVQYFSEDDCWYIMSNYGDGDGYKWRNGTDHHFWAYTKDIAPEIVEKNEGEVSAMFDYDCTGEDDILMSYAEKTWNEGDPTELSLTFKHALSYFVFESGGFTPYYSIPGYSELQTSHNSLSPVVSITGIEVVGIETSGNCLFDGSGFTWTPTGNKSSPEARATGTTNPDFHLFVIPQTWDKWGFRVTFKDETSGVELLPKLFTNDQVRELCAGIRYRTAISGKVVFPIPDVEIGGGRVELYGHKVDSYSFEGFSFDGINKIRITWNGDPDATSSGLRACIYIGEEDATALGKNEGDLKGFLANMEKDNFVYGYYIDGKGRHQVKGGVTDDGRSCSIIIDLNSDWFKDTVAGGLKIHFAYTGANASGGTGWIAENIRLEALEYSAIY